MCEIGYHICSACQEEYKCSQNNSECAVLNHYDQPCAKCEYYIDEERKEADRYERMMHEQKEWEREHTFQGD